MSGCLQPQGLYTVHGILQARILEWVVVAFPFSRESSQPRDQTQVSSITGRFFTSWVTREAQHKNAAQNWSLFISHTNCVYSSLKTDYTSKNCTHTHIHRVKDKKAILKILRQCGKFTLKKISVVKSFLGMDIVFKLLNVKLSEVHIFSCFMES